MAGPFVSALPIFPGRHQPSIFGASELNCRVRDGNGWTLTAISTDFVGVDFVSFASACGQGSLTPSRLLSNSNPLRWALSWLRGFAALLFPWTSYRSLRPVAKAHSLRHASSPSQTRFAEFCSGFLEHVLNALPLFQPLARSKPY